MLTAALCVRMAYDAGTFFDLSPGDISVLVGSNTLAPGIGDLVEVAAVFRHPDYIGTEFDELSLNLGDAA